jgi:hypothetical protein
VTLLLGLAAPVSAESPFEHFFPLVVRRPVIEHEIELRTVHEQRRDGRETEASLGFESPITPRWGISLSIPLVFNGPRDGPSTAGPGDLELESKVMLFASPDRRTLLTAGLALTLPTGSGRRGLGGRTALEPFAALGVIAGEFLIVSDVGYVATFEGPEAGRRRLHASLAVGRPVGPRVLPLLALTTEYTIHGADGRVELYLTPGVNVRILPRATLGLGIQLPVTGARAFDQAYYATLEWDL